MKKNFCAAMLRWMKFNLVGAIGMAVQLTMLALLTSVFAIGYLTATAAAVEITVLHNFAWHERFTWRDCSSRDWKRVLNRLLRFHASAGAISLGGNLVFMRLLVGQAHWPLVAANLVSIGACSVINFLVADRWIFRAPVTCPLFPVP